MVDQGDAQPKGPCQRELVNLGAQGTLPARTGKLGLPAALSKSSMEMSKCEH
jgi:hypothetical protein